MVKFKKDMRIYVNEIDNDFIFKEGYSYFSTPIKNGIRVGNIDNSVVIDMDKEMVEEYLEIK